MEFRGLAEVTVAKSGRALCKIHKGKIKEGEKKLVFSVSEFSIGRSIDKGICAGCAIILLDSWIQELKGKKKNYVNSKKNLDI